MQTIAFVSSEDGSEQPAAFYHSGTPGVKPLLVALHTWSYDYDQEMNIPYAEWCIAHDWILIAPSFRGPNNRPEATGSALAVQDVLDAAADAEAHAPVDPPRVYLAGVSGGGNGVAHDRPGPSDGLPSRPGRRSATWRPGMPSAAPQTDLMPTIWECVWRRAGGAPGASPTWMPISRPFPPHLSSSRIRTPLDINAGILDGHRGVCRSAIRCPRSMSSPRRRIGSAMRTLLSSSNGRPCRPDSRRSARPIYGEKWVLFRYA